MCHSVPMFTYRTPSELKTFVEQLAKQVIPTPLVYFPSTFVASSSMSSCSQKINQPEYPMKYPK